MLVFPCASGGGRRRAGVREARSVELGEALGRRDARAAQHDQFVREPGGVPYGIHAVKDTAGVMLRVG
jgi:hypothetical protein